MSASTFRTTVTLKNRPLFIYFFSAGRVSMLGNRLRRVSDKPQNNAYGRIIERYAYIHIICI